MDAVNQLREFGLSVRSIQSGIEPATSTGRMMLNMLATLAKYRCKLITERANSWIAASKASGTSFRRPPVDQEVVAGNLSIAANARAKGRAAT